MVGLPLNMDDSESELSARARKFARRLQGRFAVEVEMVDERLTSREAKALGREQGTQDLTKIDHIAASLILQSWLDCPEIGAAPLNRPQALDLPAQFIRLIFLNDQIICRRTELIDMSV